MRTTVTLDDALLSQAEELSGLKDRGQLLKEALRALIERESARRLIRLGGTKPKTEAYLQAARLAEVILVDTSIWIDHLHARNAILASLLESGAVAIHDFIIGEIACGNLKNREEIISLLSTLQKCEPATHEEVLFFIDRHRLMGRGIGYIDACLLASASLGRTRLWTRDKRLSAAAEKLDVAYS